MDNLAAHFTENGNIIWDHMGKFPREGLGNIYAGEGISFNFTFDGYLSESQVNSYLIKCFSSEQIDWLCYLNNNWMFFAEKCKLQFSMFHEKTWLKNTVILIPRIEYYQGNILNEKKDYTRATFMVTPKIIQTQLKKVFLSHKSIDKDIVRKYKKVLECAGFFPWLDEDEMVAGSSIHRKILDGFKDSCAAVFFVSPNFKDENYLTLEIDHAINEHIERGENFSIITLVFKDQIGSKGIVPASLMGYLYKEIDNHLDGLYEVLRALNTK